jgi:hypothetical protein
MDWNVCFCQLCLLRIGATVILDVMTWGVLLLPGDVLLFA